MALLADTSAWSRFYRRDVPLDDPIGTALGDHLRAGSVVTTGIVYLELLRGFTRPEARSTIDGDLAAVGFVDPVRADYAAAADLSVTCRRAGVQLDTVDALVAQLCISRDLTLLTADADFAHAAQHVPLRLWSVG